MQVADAVAREKAIDIEEVVLAMEDAIQKAGRAKYGQERDIRASIDRKSGAITLERWIEIVEEVEHEAREMSVADGARLKPPLALGDFERTELPPIEFGRIAAMGAKQVISQKVREAERARQFQEFKDRVGEVVVGTIKRAENYSITVDLGRAEAVIRRDEMIPREALRQGDRVRAYIIDVREETRGPQIFLSRACNEFMAKLFTQEVPEIYDGIIEIKGVAREAGSRAKIAVLSNDPGIDPVGACVGMRGSRVQAVVGELQGEKVEIIPYVEDPASFVINALAPAGVSKVVMDDTALRMDVVVPDDQLSLAIGRRGQNVRLASLLSGWHIDILTEAQESERRQEEFKSRSALFVEALNTDDVIAHLLVAEGYVNPEDVVEASLDELSTIQGFEPGIAEELQARAVEYVERKHEQIVKKLKKLKVAADLRNFEYLSLDMLEVLAENGVLTLDDLGDLDSEELFGYLGSLGLEDEEDAGNIIMQARAHWFPDDEPGDAGGDGEADADAETGEAAAEDAAAEGKDVPADAKASGPEPTPAQG